MKRSSWVLLIIVVIAAAIFVLQPHSTTRRGEQDASEKGIMKQVLLYNVEFAGGKLPRSDTQNIESFDWLPPEDFAKFKRAYDRRRAWDPSFRLRAKPERVGKPIKKTDSTYELFEIYIQGQWRSLM